MSPPLYVTFQGLLLVQYQYSGAGLESKFTGSGLGSVLVQRFQGLNYLSVIYYNGLAWDCNSLGGQGSAFFQEVGSEFFIYSFRGLVWGLNECGCLVWGLNLLSSQVSIYSMLLFLCIIINYYIFAKKSSATGRRRLIIVKVIHFTCFSHAQNTG